MMGNPLLQGNSRFPSKISCFQNCRLRSLKVSQMSLVRESCLITENRYTFLLYCCKWKISDWKLRYYEKKIFWTEGSKKVLPFNSSFDWFSKFWLLYIILYMVYFLVLITPSKSLVDVQWVVNTKILEYQEASYTIEVFGLKKRGNHKSRARTEKKSESH